MINPLVLHGQNHHERVQSYLEQIHHYVLDESNIGEFVELLELAQKSLSTMSEKTLQFNNKELDIQKMAFQVNRLQHLCLHQSSMEVIHMAHEAFMESTGGIERFFWENIYDKTSNFLSNPYVLAFISVAGMVAIALLSFMLNPVLIESKNVDYDGDIWVDYQGKLVVSPEMNVEKVLELDLSNRKVKDISEIKKLYNLKKLNLSKNKLTNLSPLYSLRDLTHLDLGNNKISQLISMVKYKYLDQSHPQSPFEHMSQLRYLNLGNNQITTTTYTENSITRSVFAGLKKLTHLSLHNNQLTSIDAKTFPKFPSLTHLNVGFNKLRNMTFVKDLTSLIDLNLAFNTNISSVCPLLLLGKLERLNLSSNNLSDVTKLGLLKNLKFLNLSLNKNITNVDFLKNLQLLEHLELAGNGGIIDITSLRTLVKLNYLDLRANTIFRVDALSNLRQLHFLALSNNPNIVFIRSIEKLKKLTYLKIRGINLHPNEFKILKGFKKLKELDLFGNHNITKEQVSDLKEHYLRLGKKVKITF